MYFADPDDSDSSKKGIASTVANHYNNIDERGKEQRKESRIYFMRNFNNWTKSMLIQVSTGVCPTYGTTDIVTTTEKYLS